jgi:hypothetical protein
MFQIQKFKNNLYYLKFTNYVQIELIKFILNTSLDNDDEILGINKMSGADFDII